VGRTGRGLHAPLTASPTSDNTGLYQTVPVTFADGKTLILTYWFKVSASPSTYAATGIFEFNGREHGLAMYTATGGANCPAAVGQPCLDENDQQNRGHDASNAVSLSLNMWHRAEVRLERTGSAIGGKVSVDGVTVDTRANDAMPGPIPLSVDIAVGAFYSGETGFTEVFIDDVLLRIE
jgi:hypothetical protein